MATVLGIDNAIGWAHFQLKGGWKNMLAVCAGYAAIVGGLIIMTVYSGRNDPRWTSSTLQIWRMWLIGIEGALLTLFAGSRVAIAIRTDITNHMYESHALMPVSPATAVSGYLWGPTLQPVGLMVVNFLLGVWVCKSEGMPLDVWTWPCIVIAEFSVFIWITAAFASLSSRMGWGAVFGALIINGFSLGVLSPILPAVMVLCSPTVGKTVFQATASTFVLTPTLLASLVAQGCIGSILYVGAARKYRRQEQTALGVLPAVLLLACWVGASYVGLKYLHQFEPRPFRGGGPDFEVLPLIISACASSMILALIPIANSARERTTSLGNFSPLIAVGCAMIIIAPVALNWNNRPPGGFRLIVLTWLAIASFLVSMCYILRIVYRVTPRGWAIGLVWMLISWLVPIVIDMAMWALSDIDQDFQATIASAISPIGILMLIWDDRAEHDWSLQISVGASVQVALAVGWMLLFHLTNRRSRGSSGALDQIRQTVE